MATETEIRPAPEDDTSNKLSSMKHDQGGSHRRAGAGTATIDWRQPEATTPIMVDRTTTPTTARIRLVPAVDTGEVVPVVRAQGLEA